MTDGQADPWFSTWLFIWFDLWIADFTTACFWHKVAWPHESWWRSFDVDPGHSSVEKGTDSTAQLTLLLIMATVQQKTVITLLFCHPEKHWFLAISWPSEAMYLWRNMKDAQRLALRCQAMVPVGYDFVSLKASWRRVPRPGHGKVQLLVGSMALRVIYDRCKKTLLFWWYNV